jgi:hypothetical protein
MSSTHRSESPVRWTILVFGCLMMVGSYYCLDIPAALKTQLGNYMGNTDSYETNFQLLYTLYAFPNVSEIQCMCELVFCEQHILPPFR